MEVVIICYIVATIMFGYILIGKVGLYRTQLTEANNKGRSLEHNYNTLWDSAAVKDKTIKDLELNIKNLEGDVAELRSRNTYLVGSMKEKTDSVAQMFKAKNQVLKECNDIVLLIYTTFKDARKLNPNPGSPEHKIFDMSRDQLNKLAGLYNVN